MFFSLRLISYLILLYRLQNRRWHTHTHTCVQNYLHTTS
jgi:hypothetical protein